MRMRRILLPTILLLVIGGLILGWNHHFRNFHTVETRVLYRSGQLSRTGFSLTLSTHRIKTVVTLRTVRDPTQPYLDGWEEDICRERGVRHVRILPKTWLPTADGHTPAEESVREFQDVIDNPDNHPVLVHCFAGVHRTGVMCAVYRIRHQGWSAERAIEEMEGYGFEPGPDRIAIEGYLHRFAKRQPELAAARRAGLHE